MYQLIVFPQSDTRDKIIVLLLKYWIIKECDKKDTKVKEDDKIVILKKDLK